VLGLAALAAGAGVLGIAAVHALTWLLQAASGLLLVHRKLHPLTLGWARGRLRALLHDGLSAMLIAFALAVIQNGSLLLYLKVCPGQTDGGQLAVVLQALSLLLLVPKGIALSTLPVLGRQVASGTSEAGRTIARLLALTLAIAAVLALLGTALAAPLTGLLLGAEYARAGAWLGPSLWLLLPFAAGQLLTQLLFAHGDLWANTARAWAGATMTLLTLWPLGALFGAPGVLTAMGLGLCLWASALLALVLRRDYLRLGTAAERHGASSLN
jgi:O-antigen/teichoic acid export membrane protein